MRRRRMLFPKMHEEKGRGEVDAVLAFCAGAPAADDRQGPEPAGGYADIRFGRTAVPEAEKDVARSRVAAALMARVAGSTRIVSEFTMPDPPN